MKFVKKIIKWLLYFLLIPVVYLLVALILTTIIIDRKVDNRETDKSIYISTNGVHLDIGLAKTNMDDALLSGLKLDGTEHYLSFGWGDENFYINTPTWGDLTFTNAFRAMFIKSTTLMHVTRHKQQGSDWVEIKVNESELAKLNTFLINTFETDNNGIKIILENQGYTSIDDFYKSKGSYSCFNTCNTWVNTGLKRSGLKACLWTPFDFGLMNKYD